LIEASMGHQIAAFHVRQNALPPLPADEVSPIVTSTTQRQIDERVSPA